MIANAFASVPRLRLLVPTLILIAGTSVGCKKAGSKKTPTASASASAGASAAPATTLAGACGELHTKICATAGATSTLCANAADAYGILSDSACAAAVKDFASTEKKIKDERKVCDELIEELCDAVGKDTATCKMVREKTPEFPPDRCKMMLEKKDAVVADLKRQELVNQPLTKELQTAISAPDAPSFGPANAKVTIVEFSDFQCPYCSKAAEVTNQVKAKYGDKVRLVFRHFPLSFHQDAKPAAEASLAAHAQGKFWEYHDKLFANQQKLDRVSLESYAEQAGLDMKQFRDSLDDSRYEKRVEADLEMGTEVVVEGTPTMFVNGERVPNPTDFGSVSQLIEKLLGT